MNNYFNIYKKKWNNNKIRNKYKPLTDGNIHVSSQQYSWVWPTTWELNGSSVSTVKNTRSSYWKLPVSFGKYISNKLIWKILS